MRGTLAKTFEELSILFSVNNMSAPEDLKKLRLKTQIGITAALGIFSMYVIIVEPSDTALSKWAVGVVGIIIGYWLK